MTYKCRYSEQGADFASLGVTPLQTVELARLMATRKVSSSTAKEVSSLFGIVLAIPDCIARLTKMVTCFSMSWFTHLFQIWQELLGSTAGGSPLEIATAKGKLQSEDNVSVFTCP